MTTPTITWHGPDRDKPGYFKVNLRLGSRVEHRGYLTADEYNELLANPQFSRKLVSVNGTKNARALAPHLRVLPGGAA